MSADRGVVRARAAIEREAAERVLDVVAHVAIDEDVAAAGRVHPGALAGRRANEQRALVDQRRREVVRQRQLELEVVRRSDERSHPVRVPLVLVRARRAVAAGAAALGAEPCPVRDLGDVAVEPVVQRLRVEASDHRLHRSRRIRRESSRRPTMATGRASRLAQALASRPCRPGRPCAIALSRVPVTPTSPM